MKLSEMQEMLKEFQDKYGDLEIKASYLIVHEFEEEMEIDRRNFCVTTEDNKPYNISHISIIV
jgi:uncharacterized membrane protein (DUF106 family)